MTSQSTVSSPAQSVQDLITEAAWRAYEEELELFRVERYEAALKAGAVHGTRKAYLKGDRCDECKEANRKYYEDRRRAKGAKPIPEKGTAFTHGTSYGYKIGCRCIRCNEYGRERNRRNNYKQRALGKDRGKALTERDIRTGLYPVIETEKKPEPKLIKRPTEATIEHEREEDVE